MYLISRIFWELALIHSKKMVINVQIIFYYDCDLLDNDIASICGRIPTFRRKLLPPSSGLKYVISEMWLWDPPKQGKKRSLVPVNGTKWT
jgi:hypothetical protein